MDNIPTDYQSVKRLADWYMGADWPRDIPYPELPVGDFTSSTLMKLAKQRDNLVKACIRMNAAMHGVEALTGNSELSDEEKSTKIQELKDAHRLLDQLIAYYAGKNMVPKKDI